MARTRGTANDHPRQDIQRVWIGFSCAESNSWLAHLLAGGTAAENAIVMGGRVGDMHQPTLLMKPEVLLTEDARPDHVAVRRKRAKVPGAWVVSLHQNLTCHGSAEGTATIKRRSSSMTGGLILFRSGLGMLSPHRTLVQLPPSAKIATLGVPRATRSNIEMDI